jgi:hypothetical protein
VSEVNCAHIEHVFASKKISSAVEVSDSVGGSNATVEQDQRMGMGNDADTVRFSARNAWIRGILRRTMGSKVFENACTSS